MLIEIVAGLVAVRPGKVARLLGRAMFQSPLGGASFGFSAFGTLAGDPEIDNLSHC